MLIDKSVVFFLVVLVELELQHFAAVGALDSAEVYNIFVNGDGILAGGAGNLKEKGLLILKFQSPFALALRLVFCSLLAPLFASLFAAPVPLSTFRFC